MGPFTSLDCPVLLVTVLILNKVPVKIDLAEVKLLLLVGDRELAFPEPLAIAFLQPIGSSPASGSLEDLLLLLRGTVPLIVFYSNSPELVFISPMKLFCLGISLVLKTPDSVSALLGDLFKHLNPQIQFPPKDIWQQDAQTGR